MKTFQNLVSNNAGDQGNSSKPIFREPTNDAAILDAYSMAVIGVVESVSPAVLSVMGRGQDARLGSGSGFIITSDGYAVTNSHVVAGRSRLISETIEGDHIDANVVGDDPATDIAVLKLASSELPHVTIGDSKSLRVGQLVIAMGSPLGLHSTVSSGIVSATGRSMRSQSGRMIDSVVQHSAPINPGNSGGPLVDTRGNVMGVNTAVIAMAQGIGFAVPSSTAQWVASEILAHGRVRRRELGIAAESIQLSRNAVREFDLLSNQVVIVREVSPRGFAAKAGLQIDDIIYALNGRLIESVDDVHRLLTTLPIDSAVELSILRGSKQLTASVF